MIRELANVRVVMTVAESSSAEENTYRIFVRGSQNEVAKASELIKALASTGPHSDIALMSGANLVKLKKPRAREVLEVIKGLGLNVKVFPIDVEGPKPVADHLWSR